MTDYSELNRLAEAAKRKSNEWFAPWDLPLHSIVDARYIVAANPATVLALIADLGSKDKTISLLHSSGGEVERILDGVIAERDQLKAEVEQLKGLKALAEEASELYRADKVRLSGLLNDARGEFEKLRNAFAPLLAHWDDVKPGESINLDKARAAIIKEPGQ